MLLELTPGLALQEPILDLAQLVLNLDQAQRKLVLTLEQQELALGLVLKPPAQKQRVDLTLLADQDRDQAASPLAERLVLDSIAQLILPRVQEQILLEPNPSGVAGTAPIQIPDPGGQRLIPHLVRELLILRLVPEQIQVQVQVREKQVVGDLRPDQLELDLVDLLLRIVRLDLRRLDRALVRTAEETTVIMAVIITTIMDGESVRVEVQDLLRLLPILEVNLLQLHRVVLHPEVGVTLVMVMAMDHRLTLYQWEHLRVDMCLTLLEDMVWRQLVRVNKVLRRVGLLVEVIADHTTPARATVRLGHQVAVTAVQAVGDTRQTVTAEETTTTITTTITTTTVGEVVKRTREVGHRALISRVEEEDGRLRRLVRRGRRVQEVRQMIMTIVLMMMTVYLPSMLQRQRQIVVATVLRVPVLPLIRILLVLVRRLHQQVMEVITAITTTTTTTTTITTTAVGEQVLPHQALLLLLLHPLLLVPQVPQAAVQVAPATLVVSKRVMVHITTPV